MRDHLHETGTYIHPTLCLANRWLRLDWTQKHVEWSEPYNGAIFPIQLSLDLDSGQITEENFQETDVYRGGCDMI